MELTKPIVVIIESDENQRYLYDIALEFQNLNVLTAPTVAEGLEIIQSVQPNLILIDEVVTDYHKHNFLEEVGKQMPGVLPPIIVTNLRDDVTRDSEQDKVLKAFDFLVSGKDTVGDVIRSSRKAINL